MRLSPLGVFVALALVFLLPVLSARPASAEVRVLKIYHVHTGEKAVIAYKRNGHYIPAGLKKLDYILRDWRKDKETDMDPRVLDLLWEVYQQSGSHDYIHIICGYRTGDTNAMLRGRSRASGVAKKSQHVLGKAIDFYIPDVRLEKVREIGMKFQVGGVGYYPNSGSPFVHMDTGFVRAWPRMSRQQLVRLFPNGRTLHLPPDGKPLPGYQEALADYKRRVSSDSIMVAGGGASSGSRAGGNFLAALFGRGTGDEDEGDDDSGATTAAAPARPSVRQVPTTGTEVAEADAPTPAAPVDLPRAKDAPLPGFRPPTVTGSIAQSAPPMPSADVGAAAATEVASADTPKYADLLAYSVPVPTDAPGRTSGSDASSAEQAALAKMANVPVPDIRPELTAYAPIRTSPANDLSDVLASDEAADAGPLRDDQKRPSVHRPVTPAIARAGDRPVILASLDTTPVFHPVVSPMRKKPHHVAKRTVAAARPDAPAPVRFATVSGRAIRGGRIGSQTKQQDGVLTREALARWAIEKAGVDALGRATADGAAPRMSRLKAAAGSAHGDGVDPQRFAAVSVYFPND